MSRILYWFQPVLGIIVAAFIVFVFAARSLGVVDFRLNALFVAAIVLPGLEASLIINQVILRRRSPRRVAWWEGLFVLIQAFLAFLLAVTCFNIYATEQLLIAPLVVVIAIIASAAMLGYSAVLRITPGTAAVAEDG